MRSITTCPLQVHCCCCRCCEQTCVDCSLSHRCRGADRSTSSGRNDTYVHRCWWSRVALEEATRDGVRMSAAANQRLQCSQPAKPSSNRRQAGSKSANAIHSIVAHLAAEGPHCRFAAEITMLQRPSLRFSLILVPVAYETRKYTKHHVYTPP